MLLDIILSFLLIQEAFRIYSVSVWISLFIVENGNVYYKKQSRDFTQ